MLLKLYFLNELLVPFPTSPFFSRQATQLRCLGKFVRLATIQSMYLWDKQLRCLCISEQVITLFLLFTRDYTIIDFIW